MTGTPSIMARGSLLINGKNKRKVEFPDDGKLKKIVDEKGGQRGTPKRR